jgi:nucleoside-diphosphate-sugar epimerase
VNGAPKLLVFGFGYSAAALAQRLAAQGWSIAGTSRSAESRAQLSRDGVSAVDPSDGRALEGALVDARAVLVAAPPTPQGCPGLAALVPALARARAYPDWLGYLSSTGVYGDHGGRWVFERPAERALP